MTATAAAASGGGGPADRNTEHLEDGCFEDLWGFAEGDGDDAANEAWGVSSSEREAYAGLGDGGATGTTMLMHSEAEVAEAGGSAQFDDLVA